MLLLTTVLVLWYNIKSEKKYKEVIYMKKILAVDGNSIINRAFYGIKLLDNGKGLYTNAIFGMINILQKNIDLVSPDICIAAFDLPAPTFRHKMYSEYKAGRHKMPDELAMQLPYAKKVLSAMGFTVVEKEGYEADDILGTVANTGDRLGYHSYILTGDRDSLQLISDTTNVLLAKTNETLLMDKERFKEMFLVDVSQFIDLKALMGDSSDNIPGVAGIGEKSAVKLLTEFDSLDNLYENYQNSSLTAGVKNKLMSGKENAYLSKKLATIERNVPLDIELSDILYNGIDNDSAYLLFKELGFTKFIEKYHLNEGLSNKEVESSAALSEKTYDAIDLSFAKPNAEYAVSFENGIFSAFDGSCIYRTESTEQIKDFLNSALIVCADSKAFYHAMYQHGIEFSNAAFDCVLGAYVTDSNTEYDKEKVFNLYYDGQSPEEAVKIFFSAKKIREQLAKVNGESLLYDIELPLARILFEMEQSGFMLDVDGLKAYGDTLSFNLEIIENRIYDYAGREFNINSPKQLGEILFEELGLPAQKKTKSGYSTSAEVLEKLKIYHPIVSLILEYRKLGKLIGTYVDGLIAAADEKGKVHTSFKQAATATGRLSSAEPNLQNIPIKSEEGRTLRKFFIPEKSGNVLIDADYSQIELRLLADISNDKEMIDAFNGGVDIHTSTAANVFGVDIEHVTPLLRKRAKAVNFGIMYGMGEFSLANDLGIPIKEAKSYIESYLANYPSITEYFERTKSEAYEKGYVETMFGRRRYIPELRSSNKNLKAFGERIARNSPIQGSAADIIKVAMINVRNRFLRECPEAKIILQVHDELLVEAPETKKDVALTILTEEMENAVSLKVILSTESGFGENWYECK